MPIAAGSGELSSSDYLDASLRDHAAVRERAKSLPAAKGAQQGALLGPREAQIRRTRRDPAANVKAAARDGMARTIHRQGTAAQRRTASGVLFMDPVRGFGYAPPLWAARSANKRRTCSSGPTEPGVVS